jgi:hypothetical protein
VMMHTAVPLTTVPEAGLVPSGLAGEPVCRSPAIPFAAQSWAAAAVRPSHPV